MIKITHNLHNIFFDQEVKTTWTTNNLVSFLSFSDYLLMMLILLLNLKKISIILRLCMIQAYFYFEVQFPLNDHIISVLTVFRSTMLSETANTTQSSVLQNKNIITLFHLRTSKTSL